MCLTYSELVAAARNGDYDVISEYSGIDVATMDAILKAAVIGGHGRIVNWCLCQYTPRYDVVSLAIQLGMQNNQSFVVAQLLEVC